MYLVDLPADSGLVDETEVKNYFYANELHPNRNGMDFITSCLLSEILEHSAKDKGTAQTVSVTYQLEDAYVRSGMARCAIVGKPFSAYLGAYARHGEVDVTVTMGGSDITASAVSGGSVYIENVTDNIVISASGQSKSYHWKAEKDAWTSVSGDGFSHNLTMLTSGSYIASAGSDCYDGTFNKANYSLGDTVVLKYNKPWVLEFKGSGAQDNLILMSKTELSNEAGNTYLHINHTNFFLGYSTGDGKFYNSGQSWANIASVLNSTADSVKAGMHVYRLVNTPNGTNNSVSLYVDGKLVDSMNAVKRVNDSTTGADSINISGIDFEFNYFGAGYGTTVDYFALNNCTYEYLKVYENGVLSEKTGFNNYRWSTVNDQFISAGNADGFVRNDLQQTAGSIEDGQFSAATFVPDTAIALYHDKPWSVEWKSEGTWRDTSTGAMLFATANHNHAYHAPYLYRRSGNDLIGFGEYGQVGEDITHFNYGIRPAEYGINTSIPHVYRLTNRITEDGSNMVYLYIDDEEIGALDNCFKGGTPLGTKSDWVTGKDFIFHYIGTEKFPIGACELEYLQVWEHGSFNHGLNDTRLQQLIDTRLTDQAVPGTATSYTDDSWAVYIDAIAVGQRLLTELDADTTQADLDAASAAIVSAHYRLVSDANIAVSAEKIESIQREYKGYTGNKIYAVELLTGDYSRIGQQTALRIATTSDVAQIGVGLNTLLTCSSQVQTIEIDGVPTVVKVWLVTFDSGVTSKGSVEYDICAYTSPDSDTTLKSECDGSLQFPVYFK